MQSLTKHIIIYFNQKNSWDETYRLHSMILVSVIKNGMAKEISHTHVHILSNPPFLNPRSTMVTWLCIPGEHGVQIICVSMALTALGSSCCSS